MRRPRASAFAAIRTSSLSDKTTALITASAIYSALPSREVGRRVLLLL